MHMPSRWAVFAVALAALTPSGSPAAESKPVAAVVETTLPSASGHIRQFAFDGDQASYFASDKNPGKDDHFTLVFDAPVAVKAVAITTGKPDWADKLDAGILEASEDGKTFESTATFSGGMARAIPNGHKYRAIRVKPGETAHPLVVREFTIESDPPLKTFSYPVEIAVASDDPEMLPWVTKAARICERQYDMINQELKSDGFKSRT